MSSCEQKPEIYVIEKGETGIVLRFVYDTAQQVRVRDLRFYKQNGEQQDDAVALRAVLVDKQVDGKWCGKLAVNFPAEDVTYKTVCFLIRQENVLGWKVAVDLSNESVSIEGTDFQV